MNKSIVRRATNSNEIAQPAFRVPQIVTQHPKYQKYTRSPVTVTTWVTFDFSPRIYLSWEVTPKLWKKGFRLMVFHSTTGFSPSNRPEDLAEHGHLMIDTVEDATYEDHPGEGAHYYTFLLIKRTWFGLFVKTYVNAFSEIIPSKKCAIERVKDRVELEDLRQRTELSPVEHAAKLNEAALRLLKSQRDLQAAVAPPPVQGKSIPRAARDAIREADENFAASSEVEKRIEELKADPEFQKLPKAHQRDILKRMNSVDRAEQSAKRELYGE